ncbi:2-amino-4-hydroxy-6-hydroxymethyldihydropteridine diphosphokinase [Isoalcanivorax beigongshangi]|uniref:2-amino-4-hydroxy-6-hydroxymethyldihydropteridine diphosphokinase n=1 Tax=Isoalcanivorax beigongshangi TaxID=3238810 RepID=A0ABV4AFJ1_9GAMM
MTSPTATRVLLGVGSNIQREQHIVSGLDDLHRRFGTLRVSPIYESAAVGFNGRPFYNLAVEVWIRQSLPELVTALREIEAAHGRLRTEKKFSSRTLDIDVLTYGDLAGEHHGVLLPRDEVYHYAHVLKPLLDLDPQGRCPGSGRSWQQLWDALENPGALTEVPLVWTPSQVAVAHS